MAYMFDDDKTKVQFDKAFKSAFDSRYLEKEMRLWQGDGTDRNGVTLNFDSLPGNINLSDYRYLMLVCAIYSMSQGEYVHDGLIIIPTNMKFNGAISNCSGTYTGSGSSITTQLRTQMRSVSYGYTANTVEVGECLYVVTEADSSTGTVKGGVDPEKLIPYELWGFI